MGETYHPRFEPIEGYNAREHPLYDVWASMKSRCNNPKERNYVDYGARGIGYWERWKHFANFVEDMSPKPFPEASIERINNDLGYSKENCKWATRFEQSRNRRTFKNNTSGHQGVVAVKGRRFSARYDDRNVRYELGRFTTASEAENYRKKFIALYEAGDPSAFKMMERRARYDSGTGVRGISVHTKGGFIVRKTSNKERVYLGYTMTLDAAVKLLREHHD